MDKLKSFVRRNNEHAKLMPEIPRYGAGFERRYDGPFTTTVDMDEARRFMSNVRAYQAWFEARPRYEDYRDDKYKD